MSPSVHFRGRPIRAVLFDLDGTLLDTANDIALALQRALSDRGLPAPEPAFVRLMIGKGSPTLIQRASDKMSLGLDAAAQAQVLEGFFHHYGLLQERGEYAAQTYPGVRDALPALQAAGLPMAVVTNKQHRFAAALMEIRGMASYFRLIVGGDTCERRKPDPQPLLWAASQLGVEPSQTLMVGDSVNDVTAAVAAGMGVACMTYGYNEGNDPRTLPADVFLDTMTELLPQLGLSAAP